MLGVAASLIGALASLLHNLANIVLLRVENLLVHSTRTEAGT